MQFAAACGPSELMGGLVCGFPGEPEFVEGKSALLDRLARIRRSPARALLVSGTLLSGRFLAVRPQ